MHYRWNWYLIHLGECCYHLSYRDNNLVDAVIYTLIVSSVVGIVGVCILSFAHIRTDISIPKWSALVTWDPIVILANLGCSLNYVSIGLSTSTIRSRSCFANYDESLGWVAISV